MLDWFMGLNWLSLAVLLYLVFAGFILVCFFQVFRGRDHDERRGDLCKRTGKCEYAQDVGMGEWRCKPGTCMMDDIDGKRSAK